MREDMKCIQCGEMDWIDILDFIDTAYGFSDDYVRDWHCQCGKCGETWHYREIYTIITSKNTKE